MGQWDLDRDGPVACNEAKVVWMLPFFEGGPFVDDASDDNGLLCLEILG